MKTEDRFRHYNYRLV